MTTLGTNGRFGNQLIQYAFIRFHAEDHGLLAELPDWIGRDLFDLTDPYPSGSLPVIFEEDFGSQSGQTLSDCNVCGFFVSKKNEWEESVRRSFARFSRPEAKSQRSWTTRCPPLVTRVRQSSPCTCAVPISGTGRFGLHPPDGTSRGSDRYGHNWISPCSISRPMRSPSFHGSRNSLLGTSRILRDRDSGADFMIDHHILRHADHVAISNSSFSFTRRC